MISILLLAKVWFWLLATRTFLMFFNFTEAGQEHNRKKISRRSHETYVAILMSQTFFSIIWSFVLWWLIWGQNV